MPLVLNGVEVDDLYLNGIRVDAALLNGTDVFQRMGPGDVIDGDIVVGQIPAGRPYAGDWLLVAPAKKRRSGLKIETSPSLSYANSNNISSYTSSMPKTTSEQIDPQAGSYYTGLLVSEPAGTGRVFPAAQYCDQNGYYLPNKDELVLIQQNMAMIDASDQSPDGMFLADFANQPILSSSINSNYFPWGIWTGAGSMPFAIFTLERDAMYGVIPVKRLAQ